MQGAGRSERSGIETYIEHGDLGAGRGDAIAVAARHARDEAMESEPAKVVGHRPGRIRRRVARQELRDVIAKLAMPKAGGGQGEETERVHERVDPAVAEAQPGGALVLDDDGVAHRVEGVFTDQAVVAQRFDV